MIESGLFVASRWAGFQKAAFLWPPGGRVSRKWPFGGLQVGGFLEQVSATGCKGSHRQLPPSHLRQAQPTQGLRSHASGCLTGPDCFPGKPGTRRRHRGSVPLGACIPFPRQAASHGQNHRRSAVVRATVQCRHTAAALLWRCAPQHRIPPRSCRQTGRAGDGTATRAVLQPWALRATASPVVAQSGPTAAMVPGSKGPHGPRKDHGNLFPWSMTEPVMP